MAKDPKRQLLGKIARQQGQYFGGQRSIPRLLHQKGAGRLQRHNQGRQDGPV